MKAAPAPRRQVSKLRRLPGIEILRRLEQQMILQDVKRRPIGGLRFAVAPVPERAQDRRSARRKRARAADSPGFFFIAHALHRALRAGALARLLEPFVATFRLQFRFQLLASGSR